MESSRPTIGNAAAVVGSTAVAPVHAIVQEIRDAEGRVVGRCSFLEKELHGPMTIVGANGQPSMEAHFSSGKLQGAQRIYDDQGALLQASQCHAGVQDGVTTTYYPSGKKMLEQRHSRGVLNGESLSYAESGDVKARIPYVAGRIHGVASYFHEGRLVRQEQYKAGLLDGESKDFNLNGSVALLTPYRANMVHGTLKRFWPDGHVMEEIAYRNGKPTGSARKFDASGREIHSANGQPGFMKSLEKIVKGY